jgi:hypothetical protein
MSVTSEKIESLESSLKRATADKKRLQTKIEKDADLSTRYARAVLLLDQLVRAAEADDATAIEQTAGAGREFLDKEA